MTFPRLVCSECFGGNWNFNPMLGLNSNALSASIPLSPALISISAKFGRSSNLGRKPFFSVSFWLASGSTNLSAQCLVGEIQPVSSHLNLVLRPSIGCSCCGNFSLGIKVLMVGSMKLRRLCGFLHTKVPDNAAKPTSQNLFLVSCKIWGLEYELLVMGWRLHSNQSAVLLCKWWRICWPS